MTRARVSLVLFALALGACTPAPPPPTVPESGRGGIPETRRVRIVTDPSTVDPFHPGLETASQRLKHCLPSSGGKLDLVITRREGGADLDIAPGTSLNPTERHCVLEALSTVELEEVGATQGGMNVKPTGFTSHLRVSW